MPGTYEHIIQVEIDDQLPTIPSTPLVDIAPLINETLEHILHQLNYKATGLTNELALTSQQLQQAVITSLGAVRTGRLRDSVTVTGGGLTAHIGTSLFYASYVHDGRGHVYPRSQKYLHWGDNIYVKEAGPVAARPWIDISSDMLEGAIDIIVENYLSSISF